MLRNRFSVALIALIVAAAPIAAFATTAVQEMIQDDAQPVLEGELLDGQQEDGEILPELEVPDEQPGDMTEPDNDGLDGEDPIDEEQPAEGEAPAGGENASEEPAVDEEQPASDEQLGEDEAVVDEPQEGVLPDEAVVEEEIVAEEPLEEGLLEEELLEEEIIVEPVAATLTIVHRLVVGEFYSDDVQVIDGLEVGQTLDLANYIVPVEWVKCITEEISLNLSQAENTVILEYVAISDEFITLDEEDVDAEQEEASSMGEEQ